MKKTNKNCSGQIFRAFVLFWLMVGAVSCSSPVGALKDYTMFTMPSKNYRIGSVIDVSKQTIIQQQGIEDSEPIISRSPGPRLVVENIQSAYQAEIDARLKNAFGASGGANGSEKVKVQLENIMLWSIPQSNLISKLTQTVGQWDDYRKEYYVKETRRRFFGILPPRLKTLTISDLLVADFKVTKALTSEASMGGQFKPSEIAILKEELEVSGKDSFSKQKDGSYEGQNLCFGYKGDPHMFGAILKTFDK